MVELTTMTNTNIKMMEADTDIPFDKLPKLPTYSGKRDAATLSIWIDFVNRYGNLLNWSDNKKLKIAILFLRNNAYRWLMTFEKTFSDKQPMTWDDFIEGLVAHFRPAFSTQQYCDQLAVCKQDGDVADYIYCFHNIIINLPNITEDKKGDRFVCGLAPEIRAHVLSCVPERLALAKENAIVVINDQLTSPTNKINKYY